MCYRTFKAMDEKHARHCAIGHLLEQFADAFEKIIDNET